MNLHDTAVTTKSPYERKEQNAERWMDQGLLEASGSHCLLRTCCVDGSNLIVRAFAEKPACLFSIVLAV